MFQYMHFILSRLVLRSPDKYSAYLTWKHNVCLMAQANLFFISEANEVFFSSNPFCSSLSRVHVRL